MSAVDSVVQLPKYCRWSLGIRSWNAQSGMKTRKECQESLSTWWPWRPRRPSAALSQRSARSGEEGRGIRPNPSLLRMHLSPCNGKGRPPVMSREGVLGSDQGHRRLLHLEGRDSLGLPGTKLHRGGVHLEASRRGVLEIIEASTAGHLEADYAQNELVQKGGSPLSGLEAPEGGTPAAPLSRAHITSLDGTIAFRWGLITVGVSWSWSALRFSCGRSIEDTSNKPKRLENHLRVSHIRWILCGVASISRRRLSKARTAASSQGILLKPIRCSSSKPRQWIRRVRKRVPQKVHVLLQEIATLEGSEVGDVIGIGGQMGNKPSCPLDTYITFQAT